MRRLIFGLGLVLTLLASLANVAPASASSSLSVTAPSSLTGGKNLFVLVRLPKPTPAGGTTVKLTSSDRGIVPIASSVEIRAGRSTASISIRTTSVEESTSVAITAEVDSTERTVKVTILPARLTALSIPTTIVSGATAKGTVSRDIASSFPTTVALSSKDLSIVGVPETVIIKANASIASFPITTTSGNIGSIVVTASAGDKSVTDSTKVTPAQLSRVSIASSMTANTTRTAKVYLTGPAPDGGLTVALASSDAAALSLPSTVTVARGQTEGAFQVVAGSPAVSTKVTLTARLDGVTATKSTTVGAGPQPVAIASIDGMPTTLVSGDATGNPTVVLTKAAKAATTVELSSSDPSVLTVPASVVVPAGRSSAAFTVSSGGVTSSTEVTVTATLPSGAKKVVVTVHPATLLSVETLGEIASDSAAAGTVTIAGLVPAGAVVKLSSSEPKLVQVPEVVEIAAGASSTGFTITTGSATEAIKFEIVASYADQTVSFTGVLLPVPVVGPAAFAPAVFTYVADAETVLTLFLTGPAPADGLTVGLEYSEGVSGDGNVWVEPGQSSATVAIRVKSGVGSVTVVAYANDMKAVSDGTVAETMATFTVERAEVTGGDALVGTFTLSAPAGPDGLTVVIESDSADVVPAVKLYLAPGESSITFKAETRGVKEATTVTLTVVEGPAAAVTVTILRAD